MAKTQTSTLTLEALLHRYRKACVALTTDADDCLCCYGDCPDSRDNDTCEHDIETCPVGTFWIAQCDAPSPRDGRLVLGAGVTPQQAMQRMDLLYRELAKQRSEHGN